LDWLFFSLGASEIGFQQGLEELAVVWHAQMEQFFDNHAFAEVGVLTEQAGVKSHSARRGTASPLSLHRPHVDQLWTDADLLRPGQDFGLEQITGNRFFQRLPLSRGGGSHGLARRKSFMSFVATSTTASMPASISAL
jgi:hypothetical protein